MQNMTDLMMQRATQKGWRLADIAREIDTPYMTMMNWGRRNGTIPSHRINDVATALDVDPNYLLGWSREVVGQKTSTNIPFYDVRASMGSGNLYLNEPTKEYLSIDKEASEILTQLNLSSSQAEKIIFFSGMGDSMEPTIISGDICVGRRVDEFVSDGIYLFQSPTGIMCKRVQGVRNKFIIKSDNDNYESYELDIDELNQDDNYQFIAKVIRTLSITSLS